jgi:hypothetical protein
MVNKVLYTLKVPLNFFIETSVVCQELTLLEGLTNYIMLVRADHQLIVRFELNYLPTDTFQRFIETPLMIHLEGSRGQLIRDHERVSVHGPTEGPCNDFMPPLVRLDSKSVL